MKRACLVFLFAAAVAAAAAQAKKAPAPPAKPAAVTLPSDAKEIEPNTYAWTDKQGKKWIYRKTPFGLVRYEDSKTAQTAAAPGGNVQRATPFGTVRYKEPAANPKASEEENYIKVREDGEQLHFERSSPFGVQKWTRKRAELADFERQAWERQKAAGTAK